MTEAPRPRCCEVEEGGSPHSWRCAHPDRYGPCTCLDDMATDMTTAVLKALAGAREDNG